MDFFDVVARRRSVRRYEDRPLERQLLERVLDCARGAPSAGNLQAYHIVVVEDAARRAALARAALDQEHVASAAAVLAFCQSSLASATRYGQRGVELYSLQDATIACAHAQLAATALGLASCWVGAFYVEQVRELLCAPRSEEPVALLTLGHPAEEGERTTRRAGEAAVRWETF